LSGQPDLTQYATNNTLNNYVSNSSLTNTLSSYAKSGDLADYLKTNDLKAKLGNLNVAYNGDVTTTQTTDTTTGMITTTSTYKDASGATHTTTTYTTAESNYVLLNRDNQWGTNDSLVKISKDGLMEANNAIISGKVYASEGDIGGNIIDSRGLHITSGCFNIDGNGDIIIQNTWTPSITINPDGVTCSIGISSFGTGVKHLYVPATVQQDGKTYKVTSIKEQAFAWQHHIETVVIADGIERIESQAFHNIIGLKSVVIPDSVTTIGFRAFSACYSLTSVVIPDSVTSMGERVFQDCDSLISATIGNGVTSIPSFMFSGCSSLINVTIGDKVSVIGQSAFADCTSIERIIIPDGVTEIQVYAFSNNPSLKTLIIPKSVTKIGQNICLNNIGIMKTGYGVYYGGSKSDWEKLNLGDGYNYHLHHAKKYYSGEWSYSSDNINGGNHFIINSANFKVLSDGTIFAQGGRFGSGRLGSSDSAFISTTDMSGTSSFFPDSSSGSDVARNNWRLTVGSKFGVTSDGSLYASAVKLGSGDIGGENAVLLNTADMTGPATFFPDNSTGTATARNNWRLTVGSNFGVTADGSMYASAGHIGGWNIGTDKLYGVNAFGVEARLTPTRIQFGHFAPDGEPSDTYAMVSHGIIELAWVDDSGTRYVSMTGKTIGGDAKTGGTTWEDIIDVAVNGGSDLRIKNSIGELDDRYDRLFNLLKPKRYKYNKGNSNRFHTGFIAQDVVSALEDSQLSTQDFAAVKLDKPGTENECWYLRRDEFVSLNTWQIQKLKTRTAELEEKVAELEAKLTTTQND
jgi:hypothetical protein